VSNTAQFPVEKTTMTQQILKQCALWMTTALLTIAAFGSAHAASAGQPLSPGVLVDSNTDVVYVVDKAGRMQAVNLSNGSIAWTSDERAYPLLVFNGSVLALGVVEQFGYGMVLLLDPRSGAIVDRIAFDLPEAVAASFTPSPERQFTVNAVGSAGNVRLHWRFQARPLRGALLEGAENEEIDLAGAVDIVSAGKRGYALPVRKAVAPPAALSPELLRAQKLAKVSGRQFRGADDAYVLATQALEHSSFGSINEWSFYDRRSGKLLGKLQSQYAFVPFLIQGKQLLYRAPAEGFADPSGQWVDKGVRLVGYDFERSRELWSVEMMDPEYRGAMPP